MKKYGIKYAPNGIMEHEKVFSGWSSCADEDGKFGTNDINQAYIYLNKLLEISKDYIVVEKI